MIPRELLVAAGIIASVVVTACDGERSSSLTAPSTANRTQSLSAASPRSGTLHVTKQCSTYTGQAGDICTITSSNL
jgi:hypothetical protein